MNHFFCRFVVPRMFLTEILCAFMYSQSFEVSAHRLAAAARLTSGVSLVLNSTVRTSMLRSNFTSGPLIMTFFLDLPQMLLKSYKVLSPRRNRIVLSVERESSVSTAVLVVAGLSVRPMASVSI